MSYSNYIVEFGDYSGFTDITNRIQGLSTKQNCVVGEMATMRCTLTVLNNDGAFTPGIGGTYSSVDLFSQAVRINKGSSSYPVFHGLIEDIRFQDDGVNATVELECVDALTVGGRSPNGFLEVVTAVRPDYTLIAGLYNGYTDPFLAVKFMDPCGMPTLGGGSTPEVAIDTFPTAADKPINYLALEGLGDASVKDLLNNQIMPCFLGVAWPTTIDTSGASAVYDAKLVNQLTRETQTTFEFGGTGIPIQSLEVGFRIDLLYNSATAEQDYLGTTGGITKQNSSSIDKYGVRHFNMTTMKGYEIRQTGMPDISAEEYFTQNYSTRFADVRYSPIRMTVLLEAAEAAGIAEATMHSLMSIDDGLWQPAEITYRPTGAAADVTEICVIAGRRINAVPGRTTITLDLLPAADYQSFVLDSTVLGVLNQNRLG